MNTNENTTLSNLEFNKLNKKELLNLLEKNKNELDNYKKQCEIIANHSNDFIFQCILEGRITYTNSSMIKALNIDENELLKKNIQELLLSEKSQNKWEQIIDTIKSNVSVHFDDIVAVGNMGMQILKANFYPLKNINNKVESIIGIYTNITSIKENEKIIEHLAYYDILTQLPNRLFFTQECFKMMETSKINSTKMAVAFIDIDDFKKINDNLGHYCGDQLLIEFAKNLKECLSVNEYVGRFAGDEFVIAFSNIDSNDIVSRVEMTKKELESHTYILNSREHHVSLSIGIAIYPDHGKSIDDLYKKSDTAMYQAKDAGKGRVVIYNAVLHEKVLRNNKIEESLKNALQNHELYLEFQPQFHISGLKIRGFETLLRWKNKEFGVVSPTEFIPIAERTGIIHSIGYWILEEVCHLLHEIQTKYHIEPLISVDISPIQLQSPDFVSQLTQVIEKNNIAPNLLELEITENVYINSSEKMSKILKDIHNLGVRISLDNFGSGYSSLSYLRSLPIDTLKIHNNFIKDFDTNKKGNKILKSIILFAHLNNYFLIAEGVEDEEQFNMLSKTDCDCVQGFYLSKPIKYDYIFKYIDKIYK